MNPTEPTKSALKPVPADYEPAYPSELTGEEIQRLLRPGLFQRFSPRTLIAGAILSGALASSRPGGAAVDPETPKPMRSTRTDAKLKQKVDRLVDEILGPLDDKHHWNDRATVHPTKELAANPDVKYPRIPISFGNSYVGIFDTEAAKAATAKMFAAYGLELKANVKVKGNGYEFVADGFDEKAKFGFKLIMPGGQVGLAGQQFAPQPPEVALDANEIAAVEEAVKAGELGLLVVKAERFPNMDGDLFTPMQYYLASVIDYLNWINGDRQIDPTKVFGEDRANPRPRPAPAQAQEPQREQQQAHSPAPPG
jgi:hypothetical protein